MLDAVKHFLPKWISQHPHPSEGTEYPTRWSYDLSREEKIFCAYAFGREYDFVHECTALINYLDLVDGVRIVEWGNPLGLEMKPKYSALNTEALPPGVLGKFKIPKVISSR